MIKACYFIVLLLAETICACNRDNSALQVYEYRAMVQWRTEWRARKPSATVRHVFHMDLLWYSL